MREIKFRCWDKENKKMLNDPSWFWENGMTLNRGLRSAWQFYEPMQYTGLKDKHNVEVYEGDIVKDACGLYKIEFSIDGNHCYYAGYNLKDIRLETPMELFNFGELEIIGNIYENAELIK